MLLKHYKILYNKIKYYIILCYNQWLIFKAMYFEVILENYPFYDNTYVFLFGLAWYLALTLEERGIDF
jgi:hypothetical protein